MNTKSKTIGLIALFGILSHAMFGQEEVRNVMFLNGIYSANGFDDYATEAILHNDYYMYDILRDGSVGLNSYEGFDGGAIESAKRVNSGMQEWGYDNVLGIGHDLGGITLRFMGTDEGGVSGTDETVGLTAMILIGTPNQGSRVYHDIAVPALNGDDSEIQRNIQFAKALRDQYGNDRVCRSDCNMIDVLEDWVDNLVNPDILEMTEGNSKLNQLNNGDMSGRSIPHVVIWGSKDDVILSELMSALLVGTPATVGTQSVDDELTNCYIEDINRRRNEIEGEYEEELAELMARNSNGVLGIAGSLFGSLFSKDSGAGPGGFFERLFEIQVNPANLINQALNFGVSLVEQNFESQWDKLELLRQRDEELAALARCELANQWMDAKWILNMMVGNAETEVVDVPFYEPFDWNECLWECRESLRDSPNSHFCFDNYGNPGDPDVCCQNYCNYRLDNHNPRILGYYQRLQVTPEPHDGILTKSEQQLDGGAAGPYHMASTHHLREPDIIFGNLDAHFQDIFTGAAGAAFIVPEK